MKLFDKKILDYDYGDDEDEMLNQSPVFQQQQHQSTAIEGIDRFVLLIFCFCLTKSIQQIMLSYFKAYDLLSQLNFLSFTLK